MSFYGKSNRLSIAKTYMDTTSCFFPHLTLLHLERPKLYRVLAVLYAIGLTAILCLSICSVTQSSPSIMGSTHEENNS